jgi:TolB-like protein/DNA-binding winged helix-turn-helix (wHTH) protein
MPERSTTATKFNVGDWTIEPAANRMFRAGREVRLEPKVMRVLTYLVERHGEVVSRHDLEANVWTGVIVTDDAVTNTVIKLRKALGDNARNPRYIETIAKTGYRLIASISIAEEGVPGRVKRMPKARSTGRPRTIIGLLVFLGAVGVFFYIWQRPAIDRGDPAPPSILVLPFEHLGNDPKQEYLADGITEDIVTNLSRFSDLRVMASNTSFAFKGREVVPQDMGTELGVKFVLKGSIRQIGDKLRVNTQLVSTETGFNLWAERYDRKISELFAVQNDVTDNIVSALAIRMTHQERNRLAHNATDSLIAYDVFQEGQRLLKISTPETNRQAREMYRKAISLDPSYGRAYGALAVTLAFDFRRVWTDAPVETLDRALELAKKAVMLDDSVPQTYWALGFVYLTRKEYDNAVKATREALRIAPNYADGYGLLALTQAFLGQPTNAIELNDKAVALNPYFTFEYLITYGLAHYSLGEYDAAIKWLEDAQERNPNAIQIKVLLAANYVRRGRQDDAEWAADEIALMSPATTVAGLQKAIPIAEPELMRAFLHDLRKSGLPE